jgi:hypothetical protein
MAQRRKESEPRRPPARTPEEQEQRLVLLATNLAEKQLRDGTATAQVITHYLRLGSTREALEQEKLARENKLLDSKTELLESAKRVEELYESVLDAMRSYSGHTDEAYNG